MQKRYLKTDFFKYGKTTTTKKYTPKISKKGIYHELIGKNFTYKLLIKV